MIYLKLKRDLGIEFATFIEEISTKYEHES